MSWLSLLSGDRAMPSRIILSFSFSSTFIWARSESTSFSLAPEAGLLMMLSRDLK